MLFLKVITRLDTRPLNVLALQSSGVIGRYELKDESFSDFGFTSYFLALPTTEARCSSSAKSLIDTFKRQSLYRTEVRCARPSASLEQDLACLTAFKPDRRV